jgi:hypothetical protein
MSKFLTLIFLSFLLFSNTMAAKVNCSGGECQFNNSYHYTYAKTYCTETLNFEEVETDFLYFTILKNSKRCDVFESRKEN